MGVNRWGKEDQAANKLLGYAAETLQVNLSTRKIEKAKTAPDVHESWWEVWAIVLRVSMMKWS